MNRLPPNAERELKIQEEHLRSIMEEGKVSPTGSLKCRCPLCPGEMVTTASWEFLVCSVNSRHWLTVKELTDLPPEKCIELLKLRAITWTCPYCQAEIYTTGEIGKCPSCKRLIHPSWYGKTQDWLGRVSQ